MEMLYKVETTFKNKINESLSIGQRRNTPAHDLLDYMEYEKIKYHSHTLQERHTNPNKNIMNEIMHTNIHLNFDQRKKKICMHTIS